MSDSPVITVLGGGSFGTALANTIGLNGSPVRLWMRDQVRAKEVQASRENTRYLPNFTLCDNVEVLSDIEQALELSLIHI